MAMTSWERTKVAPPGFPERHLRDFFVVGLRRRGADPNCKPSTMTRRELCDAYDVRGVLYFLTLAFGGLRSCEPFHVYLGDVSFDFWHGTGAIVWL
jgi:hypothetical protein